MIYEFTKKRSTAVAQLEPTLQTIAKNPESFKQFIRSVNNGYLPKIHPEINEDLPLYENDYFGNPTNILNQAYVQLIQRHDTLFFAWLSSVNNAWLKLNGV